MGKEEIFVGFCLVLLVLSVLDLFKEPYYHKEMCNFWVWAKREIWEELTYERE